MIVPITDKSYEYAQQVWMCCACSPDLCKVTPLFPLLPHPGPRHRPHFSPSFHTQVRATVRKAGIYCDTDLSNNKMQKKVRAGWWHVMGNGLDG